MNDNVTDIDLDTLDLPQLKDLARRIDQQITDLSRRQREEALQAAKAAASERGFDLAELMGQGRTSRGRGRGQGQSQEKNAPRYANPNDPAQTWSGRGRRPAWVAEALEEGASLESLTIA